MSEHDPDDPATQRADRIEALLDRVGEDTSTTDRPFCEAFALIAQYALQQGWIPIGFRVFEVGPWTITVNGTPEQRDALDPYQACVEHRDILALMIVNPFGGTVGGWQHTEAEFCAALQQAMSGTEAGRCRSQQ